ncbi:uncharacterized membrane protein (DUF485 family) [Yimella lutea]|uniref:Uncharacterized membrane protein (DUF485 family) n=1 Tax=Yimella lutea TaxID=587872 RepID=A0A542EEX8_9MICO|nr:uncharacterized membrane protein (DUF485 family) [Yimella lutea]
MTPITRFPVWQSIPETGGDSVSNDGAPKVDDRFIAVQQSPEFAELRKKFRAFVFPVTAFFLAWYFLFVLLSIYAPGFMGTKVIGNINIGILMGLGQFVTTFAITFMYARWANREFDPRADAIGARLAGDKDF